RRVACSATRCARTSRRRAWCRVGPRRTTGPGCASSGSSGTTARGRCSRSGANWPSPDLGAREDGMQGSTWLSVLGRIPAQQHDPLVIVTTTGCEIVLREIVRVEEEFIILRGRMAGSTDAGRVVILPFDQINYLGFNKLIPEAQLKAMFSGTPAAL